MLKPIPDILGSNIVLVGNFNVKSLDRLFFIKNQILPEDTLHIDANTTQTEIKSNDLKFLISQKQIVIRFLKEEAIQNSLLGIINFIKASSQLEISACGINFYWVIESEGSLHENSKKLFFNEKNLIYSKFFGSSNSYFGTYASTEFQESRLKLEIKPSTLIRVADNVSIDGFSVIFNYSFDFKDKDLIQIASKAINEFRIYYDHSLTILNEFKS